MNVSRAVSFIVNQQPPLSEMLARGLANYAAVAVDIKQGDTLHLIHGNYEVSIITNEKHKGMMLKRLAGHRIINVETSLVALSLRFGKEFMHTPGVVAQV